MRLHITNGEAVSLHETGLPGDVIYWRDILHEGPVPGGLSLEELREHRVHFLAEEGIGSVEEMRAVIKERDDALARFHEYEEVVMWFEHDLYDQLQIIQVLDFLLTHNWKRTKISLLCVSKFPGIGRFKGLGQLTGAQLLSLFEERQAITLADLKLASQAWFCFTSPNPADLENLLGQRSSVLPLLKGALARHLEQFPSVKNGLSRTERQILEVIVTGVQRMEDLFLAEQDKEERVFMGDTTFWRYVDRLRSGRVPLIDVSEETARLTPAGHKVLVGQEDAIQLNGIDRWLGGVHLRGPEAEWRWDDRHRRLVKRNGNGAHRD